MEGELDATGGHNPPPPGEEAPRAEPEDDIDFLKPEAQEETLHDNFKDITTKVANAFEMEQLESARVSHSPSMETQEIETELEPDPKEQLQGLEAHKEPEESESSGEDTFQPHSSFGGHASPTEDNVETEVVSSPEGELAERTNNMEVISDTTKDLPSSDSQNSEEKPLTIYLTDPIDRDEESNAEKMEDRRAKTGEAAIGLESMPYDLDNNESEQDLSGAAAETIPPSNRDNSDDMFTIDSPPFANEGDEEEEGSVDCISSARRQWVQLHSSSSKPPQPSYLRSSSTSSQPEPVLTHSAISTSKQQGEQLLQSQPEYAPGEEKQEAGQQVFSRGSPPLVSVATEPANQGEAGSQGSGCAVAVREKGTETGERREGESRQTGRERGQKACGLDTGKAVGQQHTKEYSMIVKQHELKIEKYSTKSDSRALRMECDSYDDSQSDSGVSADFSPCSTMEIHTATTTPLANETPIEREIRRAVEREHSLRRSRGLQNPPATPEYVEVPLRKSILTQNLPVKCEKSQVKDRQFAGKKMQQEIHTEAQREQVLVQLGKVPGIYDKGTVRQLKERKMLFEAFQEPKDSSSTLSPQSKTPSWASASDLSTLENQGDDSSTASTLESSYVERRQSVDLLSQTQIQSPTSASFTNSAPRGPGLSEGTSCQVIILENNLGLPATTLYPSKSSTPSYSSGSLTKAEALTVTDSGTLYVSSARMEDRGNAKIEEEEEEEGEELVPKENPFFKLRSSTTLDKVEQDIREARERERELRKQRSSLYGGTGAGGGGGGGVERGGGGGEVRGRLASREIQSLSAPPQLNGPVTLDLPTTPSTGGAGTPAG